MSLNYLLFNLVDHLHEVKLNKSAKKIEEKGFSRKSGDF